MVGILATYTNPSHKEAFLGIKALSLLLHSAHILALVVHIVHNAFEDSLEIVIPNAHSRETELVCVGEGCLLIRVGGKLPSP